MNAKSLTIRQLIDFKPKNDREKEIYNINQAELDNIKNELDKGIFFLGGQIKMTYDYIIDMDIFNKVRQFGIESQYMYRGPCNSWEAMSIITNEKRLQDTEYIVKKYFEIMKLREESK